MVWLRRLLLAVLFVALLVGGWRFADHNAATVTVGYVVGEFEEVSLWLALLAAFAAGFALAALYWSFQLTRANMVTRRYRRAVAGLEAEVHELRNLPLVSEDEAREPIVDAEPGEAPDREA